MVQVLILFKILLVPKSARRVESLVNIHPKSSTTRYLTFWVLEIIPLDLMLMMQTSVQFSHSVVSDSLRPHGLQHARPPCPSPTTGAHPNPFALSWWCHPNISSSVVTFSSHPQSFPASESFQMSQLFTSGGQNIEQIPGDSEGQRSLACCSPWGRKESDTIEWLNWTESDYHTLLWLDQTSPHSAKFLLWHFMMGLLT